MSRSSLDLWKIRSSHTLNHWNPPSRKISLVLPCVPKRRSRYPYMFQSVTVRVRHSCTNKQPRPLRREVAWSEFVCFGAVWLICLPYHHNCSKMSCCRRFLAIWGLFLVGDSRWSQPGVKATGANYMWFTTRLVVVIRQPKWCQPAKNHVQILADWRTAELASAISRNLFHVRSLYNLREVNCQILWHRMCI